MTADFYLFVSCLKLKKVLEHGVTDSIDDNEYIE